MADETAVAPATTKTIVIQGVDFQAPIRFATGHVLTDIEARVLNQVLHENLRNNFAKQVKATNEKTEGHIPADKLQVEFDKYAAGYSFATPGAGVSRTLDPVEREARDIATEIVKDHLAKQGRSWNPPKEASDEEKAAYKQQRDAKVEEVAGRPTIMEAARKNVAARSKTLSALSAGLDL